MAKAKNQPTVCRRDMSPTYFDRDLTVSVPPRLPVKPAKPK